MKPQLDNTCWLCAVDIEDNWGLWFFSICVDSLQWVIVAGELSSQIWKEGRRVSLDFTFICWCLSDWIHFCCCYELALNWKWAHMFQFSVVFTCFQTSWGHRFCCTVQDDGNSWNPNWHLILKTVSITTGIARHVINAFCISDWGEVSLSAVSFRDGISNPPHDAGNEAISATHALIRSSSQSRIEFVVKESRFSTI